MYRKILYVVAALFFLLTISIQSCRKNGNNVEITQAKTQLSLKMEKLKMQFEQLNYQQYLSQSLSDSVRQFLYPSWKQAYQIKQGDSAVFTYVKLWPRLFLNDSSFNYLYKSVARQYILVEEKNGRTVFYKVSAVDFGGPNATTFKGNLEVENLQTHKTNVLHFNSDKYRRSGNTATPQARNPDDPECFYYFTCTYSGICNNIVTIVGAYGGPSV